MSEVIDSLLEKYPTYRDMDRNALIDAVGTKYPAYLAQPDFKDEFDSLQALNKSVQGGTAPATSQEPTVPASQAFDQLFAKPSSASATMPVTTSSPLTEGAAQQADVIRTGQSRGIEVLGDTSNKPFISLPKPVINPEDPDRLKVAKGMATAISSGLESVLTEQGLETLAIAGPAAPLVFGTLGAMGTVKGGINIATAKTPEERGVAIGETLLNAGMAALAAKSGIGTKADLAPKTVEAATAVIKEGAPNAEQISSAAPFHGDVLNEPGTQESTREVPTDEGSQGIQARGQRETLLGSEGVTPSPSELPTGPGAARPEDVGMGESNIDPLQRVTDVINHLPAEPGLSLGEQLRTWGSTMAKGAKDSFATAIDTARAGAAWIKDNIASVPKADSLDRAVGKWSLADQELSFNSRLFAKAVAQKFPRPDTLNALSKYVEANGDASLLAQRAAASKEPYRKMYEDAQSLTEDQKRLADEVKYYFDQRLQQAVNAGALEGGVENFVHRMYEQDSPEANRVLADLNSGKLRTDFSGFKKRFYATDFEAEQAGKKPVSNLAQRILHYDQGFNRALTARAFVKSVYDLEASDGRPLIDVYGRGDQVIDKDTGDTSAYLVKPHQIKGRDSHEDYRGDYVKIDHPAFRKWVWATADENGVPIMVEGTLGVHPELGKSRGLLPSKFGALFDRSWFQKTPARRLLLKPSSVVKQTMLSISAFHPVQIAQHALEHKVTGLVDINFKDPAQSELIEGGLMVADHSGSQLFSEGVSGVGLTEKIPIIGQKLTAANELLFKEFIPRVKMSMALEALDRNLKAYQKDITAGKITREDMVRLTAREANAAFGEQNYRAMFRHPSFQDLLRFGFLAPDFGEARVRFGAQSLTRYGGEQRMALALGAVGMWAMARLINKAVNDDYEWDKPFSVVAAGKEYSLRNVAADMWRLATDPSTFVKNRLNPLYSRTALEFITKKDNFGRPRDSLEQLQDLAQTIIPISFRSDKERTLWENFLGALGVVNKRFTAETQVRQFVADFNKSKGNKPAIQIIEESPYLQLRRALENGDTKRADKELTKLETSKSEDIILKYFDNYADRPFAGSKANDEEMLQGLSDAKRKIYTQAQKERQLVSARFDELWRQHSVKVKAK